MRARKVLAVEVPSSRSDSAGCGSDDDEGSGDSGSQERAGRVAARSRSVSCRTARARSAPSSSRRSRASTRPIAAGAKAAGEKPSDGLSGAKVAGKNIEVVGYGCADDTADKAIEETRRLMEQEDADILVGPLSGDEGIAVANYAKEHPDKTFINGIAGAQDST